MLVTIPILLLGLTPACRENQSTRAVNDCPHDTGLRTYEQWRRQVTFPYAAPEKLHRVRINYDRVGAGSSKDQVIEAFGSPDFEDEGYPKEQNRPCIGYEFRYYFEKPTEATNEINDKAISVFFTPSGKAKWIVGNVGLPEKGGPGHSP
jgi:hypothetical protein